MYDNYVSLPAQMYNFICETVTSEKKNKKQANVQIIEGICRTLLQGDYCQYDTHH